MAEMTLEPVALARRALTALYAQVPEEVAGSVVQCMEPLIAHAERTLAARSGEPEQVTAYRNPDTRSWAHASYVIAHIDYLTARLAEVEAQRDEEIARTLRLAHHLGTALESEKALRELLIEATTDRNTLAGIVERVRKMCSVWADLGSYPTSYREAVADINRALTPTREGPHDG